MFRGIFLKGALKHFKKITEFDTANFKVKCLNVHGASLVSGKIRSQSGEGLVFEVAPGQLSPI